MRLPWRDLGARQDDLAQRLAAVEARLAELTQVDDNLGVANHETRMVADGAMTLLDRLGEVIHDHELRVERLERLASIRTVGAWVAAAHVPESLPLSIILPTRNRSDWLPDAIASVLAQSYQRWELIVIDDGSSDATADVLARVDDPRVRVLTTSGVGVCAARNLGLDAATGDAIVYLDDDNVMHPHWLKSVAWAFSQRPDVDVLYAARVIDDIDRVHQRPAGGLPFVHFERFDRQRLEEGNIADTGVLAHRAKLPEARFDQHLAQFGDWDLFLRLTADRPPLELPVIAIFYSTHAEHRISDRANHEAEQQAVLRKLAPPG